MSCTFLIPHKLKENHPTPQEAADSLAFFSRRPGTKARPFRMATLTLSLSPLGGLWQSVGLPPDEREAATAVLHEELKAHLEQVIQTATERFNLMRAEVPEMQAQLAQLAEVLGTEAKAIGAEGEALVPQHRKIEAAVKEAGALRAERLESRVGIEAKLQALFAELDGEDGEARERRNSAPLPAADVAGGLTEALIGRLQRRLDDTNDEHSKRVATIEALRAQAAELRTMMGYPMLSACAGTGAISLAALAAAEADVADLDRERGRRTAVLHECRDFIAELRTKLELPESEWAKLPDGDEDLSQGVLEAFQAEIERLEELKFAKLGPLVRRLPLIDP